MEKKDQYGDDDMSDGEEESYDSMEGKPEDYVKLIKEARPKFIEEETNDFYSRALLLIGKQV